jgi:hypothetical protein
MCKRFLLVVLALAMMSSLCYGWNDILLISDSGYRYWDEGLGNYVTTVASVPGGKYVDSTLVDWLTSLGYTVDTTGMGGNYWDRDPVTNAPREWWNDAAKMQHINDAELIIVSKYASSNRYDGEPDTGYVNTFEDRWHWNTLEKPIVSLSPHLADGTGGTMPDPTRRWGWTNAGNNRNYCDSPTTATEMLWSTLMLDMNTQLFDWSTAPGGVCPANDRPALNVGDWPATAQLIGFYDDTWTDAEIAAVPARADKAILVDIPEGTDLDAFCGTTDYYGTTGGNRVLFGIWNYDSQAAYYFGLYLTPTYLNLFAQIIDQKIPEPATIALLGLGGLALLRKKR